MSYRGLRTRLALLAALVISSSMAFPTAPVAAGSRSPVSIHLISQMQYVSGDPGSLFRLSIDVDRSRAPQITLPSALVVSSHRPVDSRGEVRDVVAGTLTRLVDSVRIDLTERVDADGGPVDVLLATEVDTRSRDLLQLPEPGLYPLRLSWEEDGVVTSSFVTFIERLPAGTFVPQGNDGLRLAVVGGFDSSITLQPNSTTVVADVDRQVLFDLVSVVETLPELPVTMALRPELVEALDRSSAEDGELLSRLQAASSLRLPSTPYVDVDPSDLAAPGSSALFRRQLRLGEDVIAALLPTHINPRLMWYQDRPLTNDGGLLLAELGLRNVVLSIRAQNLTAEGASLLADSTRKVNLRLSDDSTVSAGLVDAPLSSALTRGSRDGGEDPDLVAQHVLAELKALLLDLERDNDSVAGRGLLLSTEDGSLPSPDMLTALHRVVGEDPRFDLVAAENLVSTMSVNLVDGRPVVIDLPPSGGLPDPGVAPQVSELTATVNAFSSMLPQGDFRPRQWRRLLDVLPHAAFDQERRDSYISVIRDDTLALASTIGPPMATTFTLGGRSSPLRFSIRNDGETDVRVRVRLTSSKLTLPEGDKVVLVPAQSSTAVDMPVEARSNGRFPVNLQLFTPEGGVAVSPIATLTARVNALAGLGQLVTGIAVLLLVSWWVSHFRRQHQRRQLVDARSARRHPSENRPT